MHKDKCQLWKETINKDRKIRTSDNNNDQTLTVRVGLNACRPVSQTALSPDLGKYRRTCLMINGLETIILQLRDKPWNLQPYLAREGRDKYFALNFSKLCTGSIRFRLIEKNFLYFFFGRRICWSTKSIFGIFVDICILNLP